MRRTPPRLRHLRPRRVRLHHAPPAGAIAVALLLLSPLARADLSARWVAGPSHLDAAPAARNPSVDARDGQVHIVYRVRDGGIGHITGPGSGSPTEPIVIPGSQPTAAVARPWNLPVVVVDSQRNGHVVWGPQSGTGQTGVWYARVAPDGTTAGAQKLTSYWSEDLAAVVLDGRVHVLTNAVGDTPGVFDFAKAATAGEWTETQAWPFGNFDELSVAVAPWHGLAVLGRLDVPKRIDLTISGSAESWGGFANHGNPPFPVTSVGRPRIAFDGNQELWAVVGWAGQVPSAVVVTDSGDAGWTTLSAAALFDPSDADGGGPSVGLAINEAGHRAVAWLSADGPRLKVAIGEGQWGVPVALPETDAATTFAMCAEGEAFRLVFVNDDGTVHTGRVAGADPVEPSDAGAGTDGSLRIGDAGWDAPVFLDDGAAANTGGQGGAGGPRGNDDAPGCSCGAGRGGFGGDALWMLALLIVAGRRWRVRLRPRRGISWPPRAVSSRCVEVTACRNPSAAGRSLRARAQARTCLCPAAPDSTTARPISALRADSRASSARLAALRRVLARPAGPRRSPRNSSAS